MRAESTELPRRGVLVGEQALPERCIRNTDRPVPLGMSGTVHFFRSIAFGGE
jgi:hypothetical protein